MKKKITKISFICLISVIAVFMSIQFFMLPSMNEVLIFQMIMMDMLILIGIYSFRGFEIANPISLNKKLITFTAGTVLGTLVSILIILFFKERLNQFFFMTTVIMFALVLPVLYSFMVKRYIKSLPVKKYLVIGKKHLYSDLINEISLNSHCKIEAFGYINPSPETLKERIKNEDRFNDILIADPALITSDIEKIIKDAKDSGKTIEFLPNVVESYLGRIPIEIIEKYKNYYEVAFNEVNETPAKRVVDIAISILALIVLSPLMLFTALWILIEDGRPVIFKQERIGKDGKPFIMNKFRSMKNRKSEENAKFATDEQHRILRIGRIMRPIRLDETVQFWDILRGEMSFIGPRPEQKEFVEEFKKNIPYYDERHRLKPGLTGWAQIRFQYAANAEQTKKKLSYDLYYIKNRSMLLDLRIILQTIEAVVLRRGAK